MMRVFLALLVGFVPTAVAALPPQQQVRTRQLQASTIRLALINANTDQEIVDLVDGATIVLSALPSTNLNLKAVPATTVTSVQFDYDGITNFRSEFAAPYGLCSNAGVTFEPCPLAVFAVGSHTLTVTGNLSGAIVATRTIKFTVVNSNTGPTAPQPTPVANPVPAPVGGLPWVESFDGLPNGAQSDTGATAWTLSRPTGKFDVQNGALVITGNGGEGVWQTQVLNIAGRAAVDVSVQVQSIGRLELNQDYVRLYVSVNNGPPQLVGGVAGAVLSAGGITTIAGRFSGTTIRVVIRAFVSAGDEFYTIDNIRVGAATGPAPVPAPVTAPVQPTPTSSSTVSAWLAPVATPVIAVAAAHLPDGKILMWSSKNRDGFGTDGSTQTWTAIYNPATGG
jgi:hypothetical protein